MRIMLTTAALALLAGLTLAGQPVFAGGHYPHYGSYPHARHRGVASPEALARWYADRAHHQTVRAARLGCGYSGPRWRINWNGHYRWAFTNPTISNASFSLSLGACGKASSRQV